MTTAILISLLLLLLVVILWVSVGFASYNHLIKPYNDHIDLHIDEDTFEMKHTDEVEPNAHSHEDVLMYASDLALVMTSLPPFTMVGAVYLDGDTDSDIVTIQDWGQA